jgi:hypothetical protein
MQAGLEFKPLKVGIYAYSAACFLALKSFAKVELFQIVDTHAYLGTIIGIYVYL